MEEQQDTVPQVRVGDILRLDVDKIAFEGRAVARTGGLVVFVDGGIPGDTVMARVFRKKKQYAEAAVQEILARSPERVDPVCAHFGTCGGCSWQHLEYAAQCRWKREHVRDAFERIGGFAGVTVHETLPSPVEVYYRNKMEYSFGDKRWLLPEELGATLRDELFALGLHVPGRYDRILSIDACHLQSPESNAILNATRDFFLARGVPAYSTKTHTGDLRNLVIREGKRSGERMVYFVSTHEEPEMMREYAELLREERFGVTTFVHGITQRKSTVAVGETETVYFGPGVITEQLGDCSYELSPTSFFQTNTLQAERLYALAAASADFRPTDTVWDLYCGAGTITLFIAPFVKEAIGVELNPASIADAQKNAAANGVSNVSFRVADILAFLRSGKERGAVPDVIIVDPPRAGLHPDVTRGIGALGVERVVYVSCNPATSARDCQVLAEYGYVIEGITPVDMFPHTYHIECVITLRKSGKRVEVIQATE
ncbi:MAG: 23S rRNA (uracil(1939)-C(5))-methyltransferase RlmD [Ignavibacteria bacterium]|nr:23S rRNA (uracil(1939)-C(5))-methyltransferase RlmD [Ignavibacteria bacterium]